MNTFKKYTQKPPGNKLLRKWNCMVPEDHIYCPLCGDTSNKAWYEFGNARALICSNCDFKYISPRLSERQIEKYYSQMYTGRIPKDFEGREHDFFNNPVERKRKIQDRHVEIELTNRFTPKRYILDIGCGSGLYFEGLEGNFKLFGIEMSRRAAEYTKQRFGAEVTMCDVMAAGYDTDFFDVINMTYIIEHLTHPGEVMRKVYRWLRLGGLLIVSSPNWGSIMSRIYRELFRLNDPCQHINLWDERSLKRFLIEQGFAVKKVRFPYFKTEYFNSYEVKRLFRNTFYRVLLPVSVRLGYYPPPEKILSPPFRGNIMVFECYKEG